MNKIFTIGGDWLDRYVPQPLFWVVAFVFAIVLIVGMIIAWCILPFAQWRKLFQ